MVATHAGKEPGILVATSAHEAQRLWRELDVANALVALGLPPRLRLDELVTAFAARFPAAPVHVLADGLGPGLERELGLEPTRVARLRGLRADDAIDLALRRHRDAASWREAQLAASRDFCAQHGVRRLLATRARLCFHMIPPELIATMLEQSPAGGRAHARRLQALVGESSHDGLMARIGAFAARRAVRR